MIAPSLIPDKLVDVLPANSLRRRFATGAFWSIVAAFTSQGSQLMASLVVARILGKTGFGEFGMILSTVAMFGVFAGLGLGLTATKHIAEFRSRDPIRAGHVISLSLISALISAGSVSMIVFLISPYLAGHTIRAPHLVTELRVGCGLLFFNTLIGVQLGVLCGFEAFRTIAKVNLFRGLLTFPLVVLGVYFWGVLGAVSGMVCAMAAGSLINYFALQRETYRANITIPYRGISSQLHLLWRFSLPAFLSGAMVGPVKWAANALLVNQVGGYAELGIFTAATQIQILLQGIGTKVGGALLPILASGDAKQNHQFNCANIMISWLIGLIPALLLISFPETIGLLFGSQYGNTLAQRTHVLVMCYVCIIMYKQGLARVLAANSLMWWGFLNNAIWALLLLASFSFLKQFGAVGLAGAFTIAYVLNTVCLFPLYIRRKLVPKGTLISLEAAAIWIAVIGLALFSIFEFPMFLRAVGLLVSILSLYVTLPRLFRVRRSP